MECFTSDWDRFVYTIWHHVDDTEEPIKEAPPGVAEGGPELVGPGVAAEIIPIEDGPAAAPAAAAAMPAAAPPLVPPPAAEAEGAIVLVGGGGVPPPGAVDGGKGFGRGKGRGKGKLGGNKGKAPKDL